MEIYIIPVVEQLSKSLGENMGSEERSLTCHFHPLRENNLSHDMLQMRILRINML